jgi:hypothetical protein
MQARLSPEGALGLHLTLGILILLGASGRGRCKCPNRPDSFSRIYLGVHYLSDVLGGMAAGVAGNVPYGGRDGAAPEAYAADGARHTR